MPLGTSHPQSNLDGICLQFKETMSGYIAIGETDCHRGAERGKEQGTLLRFDVTIRIPALGRFLRDSQHEAELNGTVSFDPLGGTLPISHGRFNLFTIEPRSGLRQMTYAFRFTGPGGREYCLRGHKDVSDDPGKIDVFDDMTRLFVTIYAGSDEQAPVYGAGELLFNLLMDGPAMIASMEVEGASSWRQRVAAYAAFTSFAYGVLRNEYLKDIRLVYDTRYENLVLAGTLEREDKQAPFFFVSGVHDKGFPWGDSELFWDVLLVIGDRTSGYRRFVITERFLEDLELDITSGCYRYRGPLFTPPGGGYSTSFSAIHSRGTGLVETEAEIEIEFQATEFHTAPFPFPLVGKLARKLSSRLAKALRESLPGENPLGIYITPHTTTVRSGALRLGDEVWRISSTKTFGEAERGTFRNVKEPTLLYGYLCALQPEQRVARVQIHSRTLRDEREHWAKDRLDAFLGAVINRMSSAEVLMEGGKQSVKPLPPTGLKHERATPMKKLGEPVIEVNNDHFPTAVFQRRIVEVAGASGERCLALEEDTSRMRLEAKGTDRKATVASIRGEDKFAALDQVLAATGFDALLEARLSATGKQRTDFQVAVKPNFMFAYDKRDRSTYTDPELVAHLIKRLRSMGFENISVVEAHSTYGQYFNKRSVREMAEYLGFDERAGYTVVDLTLDAAEERDLGPYLGPHPVPRTWRDADFRISFAKNKTHAYAYFSLALKNIYGALPLANKFKEYHCDRDIYHTTIDYLKAFPVHFGLVDAWLSADGPFGVFADTDPNETRTIIGGDDLVAVDWVGATKMGIDPMISQYVRLAVEAFGKPEIRFIGDANPYRPWLNPPAALTLFAHGAIDATYHFGNLFYAASAQMDETHFQSKSSSWFVKLLRKATLPVRRTFFLRTGENPSWSNRLMSWLLYRMGF